jgi:uncharacterized SAM-binding protein YcdF (DUF218 family)
MTHVLSFFFQLEGMVAMFLLAAIFVCVRPRSAAARRVLLIIAVGYTAASTFVVPDAVNRVWARHYRPLVAQDVTRRPAAIVLLGGGEERIRGWSDRVPLMEDVEAERVVEAWRVFKLTDAEWIVSSGAASVRDGLPTPTCVVMRDALVQLGVPSSRILLDSSSFDTHEEAVMIAPMLRERNIQQIVLVTSAVHMPRSVGAFRALGMETTPAIAPDPGAFRGWNETYLPSRRGLEMSSQLAHELVGLPYYWMRGWWR